MITFKKQYKIYNINNQWKTEKLEVDIKYGSNT